MSLVPWSSINLTLGTQLVGFTSDAKGQDERRKLVEYTLLWTKGQPGSSLNFRLDNYYQPLVPNNSASSAGVFEFRTCPSFNSSGYVKLVFRCKDPNLSPRGP